MSGSFYVEESGMGKSSERLNLVDDNAEGNFREETQEEIARVKEEINVLKREKVIVLLRGFLKKCVSEIQKKLSDRETCLGVLSEVQGLLRAVGEKEAMQESEKSNDSLDGLDLSGRFQQQFLPVKPLTPDGPDLFMLQAMKEAHRKSLAEVTSVFRESLAATVERLTFPSGEGG